MRLSLRARSLTGFVAMVKKKNEAFDHELGSFPHLKTDEIHGILTNMACG